MIEINDECMFLTVDGKVVATVRFSRHAVADGRGAWIVSCLATRLLTHDQAITALTVAELLATGVTDTEPRRSRRRPGVAKTMKARRTPLRKVRHQ